ncbi:hypothetical protein AN618_21920 [Fervidicola ferrireducens]|uniref:Uncharacterized protein n=1 Tax=Fervidicola ferrireducens TaxID=520764 RepID=A0A140L287_9FIRM|nr:hypothetical protein [Fervidicola ferrireducens]KXG74662.1 hypothetical protein AN618_21920 [Fervidicola ferrireducens]
MLLPGIVMALNNTVLEKHSLEEYISAYISLKEQAEENKFIMGQLLDEMIALGAKIKWLSSQLGDSPAKIRELIKTYKAFPTEDSRVPELSWYHHRLAANTDNPQAWIALAAERQWSTREMKKAIDIAQGRIEQVIDEKEKKIQEIQKHVKALREIAEKDAELRDIIVDVLKIFLSEI